MANTCNECVCDTAWTHEDKLGQPTVAFISATLQLTPILDSHFILLKTFIYLKNAYSLKINSSQTN